MLFWNHLIVFLQEGFLEIALSIVICFSYIKSADGRYDPWANSDMVYNNLCAIVLVITSSILFLFLVFYLWPRSKRLSKKKMRRKYGSAYEMINIRRRGTWSMFFPVFFFVRRMTFVWAVCMLYDNNVMQILFYMLPTLILMCHLGMVHPLRELRDNRIEMYNCFTIMCLSYCLMCYTPYVYDAEARYQIGFFMIGLIAQNLLVNIYLVGKDPLRMMILKCRHSFRNRKQIKAKWALKAQKTKMFFKRTFTRLTGSKKTDIDELDASANKKSAYALHTISEGSNEEDSNGEDNPIRTKQRKKQQKAREIAQ